MLVNEDSQWTIDFEEKSPMFPESKLLDQEYPLSVDDFLQQIDSELELPNWLAEDSPIFDVNAEDANFQTFSECSQSSDGKQSMSTRMDTEMFSVFDAIDSKNSIKIEPKSPFSQLSTSSSPSQSEYGGSINSLEFQSDDQIKFRLDTPPISPPENESPPISPTAITASPAQKRANSISIDANDTITTQFVYTSGNPPQRFCIKPKVALNNEQSRKTIVLSAQDFAALAQKVEKNGKSQPIKIQTLAAKSSSDLQKCAALTPLRKIKTEPTRTGIIPLPTLHAPRTPQPAIVSLQSVPSIVTACAVPPIVIKHEIGRSNGSTSVIIDREKSLNSLKSENELKALKRQQRMIKNRESACLSRKKKKEYVTALEKHIDDLKDENQHLRTENAALKQRLSQVGGNALSVNKLGTLSFKTNKKSTVFMLAMVFMFYCNFGLLGNVLPRMDLPELPRDISPSSSRNINVRSGRSLLWSLESSSEEDTKDTSDTARPLMCPMYVNKTESIRMDDDLRRWISYDSEQQNLTTKSDPKVKFRKENLPMFKKTLKEEKQDNYVGAASNNSVELYLPMLRDHAELFEKLGVRKDTFYVILLDNNHISLAASQKNSSVRPKMVLILPVNRELPEQSNHKPVMKIACEVMNTEIAYIHESIIPKNSWNSRRANNGTSGESGRKSKEAFNATQTFKPYFRRAKRGTFLNNP